MTTKRIYRVSTPGGTRLIKASTPASAIRTAASTTITAEVASQDDLVRLLPTTKVEEAGAEPQGEPAA